jgi:hypothetical protein
MGRRLWWALVMFDARISEQADSKSSPLEPSWDCKIPINVNEAELRPEMKELPVSPGTASDAIFVIVRSELGNFIRHSASHLDFTNPALKEIAKASQKFSSSEVEEGLPALEGRIENNYLKFCDPEHPLHYMTIWVARATIARFNLMQVHWKISDQAGPRTEEQRDLLNSYALKWLNCESKLGDKRLTKGFLWLADAYFPLPAYLQIITDLRRRPVHKQAEQFWDVLSKSYIGRWIIPANAFTPILKMFSSIVFQAWEARETALYEQGKPVVVPGIVSYLKTQQSKAAEIDAREKAASSMISSSDDLDLPLSTECGNAQTLYSATDTQDRLARHMVIGEPSFPGQPTMDLDMDRFNWAAMNWSLTDPLIEAEFYQAGLAGLHIPSQPAGFPTPNPSWTFRSDT